VIPEHFEDIALRYENHYRYIQVKTKRSGSDTWRLSDVAAKGGALPNMYRSFTALSGSTVRMELVLEGSLRLGDDIDSLQQIDGRDVDKVRSRIHDCIEKHRPDYDSATCDAFLECLSVRSNPYNRQVIDSVNIRLLADQAPRRTMLEIRNVYTLVLEAVERAMEADPVEMWPGALIAETVDSDDETRLRAKTLDAAALGQLFVSLTRRPRPLLGMVVSEEAKSPGPMLQKLLLGGADQRIVEDAKLWRAAASEYQYEQLSSGANGESLLQDVRVRLRTVVDSLVATAPSASPANVIWSGLLDRLSSYPAAVDPDSVFLQDPLLLMGAACELSDLCVTDWGRDVA